MAKREYDADFSLGDKVEVTAGVIGVVEEIVLARFTNQPFYLVEWWNNGDLCRSRFFGADLRLSDGD